MSTAFLTAVFHEHRDNEAIIWKGTTYDYQWLLDRFRYWQEKIHSEKVDVGSVVILEADFSPNSVALFLALQESGCIVVPLTSAVEASKPGFIEIAQGQISFVIDADDAVKINKLPYVGDHPLYAKLRKLGHPGIVVFSSASTGASKAAVHDMTNILKKFTVRRKRLRAITFLLYDHLGGINTMLYQLSNGGCTITVRDRNPDGVLSAVERHRVELLATTPTFINLMVLSEAYREYDLSSLQIISYGTEPMPESTLGRLHELLPNVELLQTYGLSELGVLRSKSKSSDSLWFKVGGEGFETRVVGGTLQIKAESAMLGYLNAPNPFTDDGWFDTGDLVEVDGQYIKILGRQSDVINVGGEKVYPAEVESVIQEMENVVEAVVYHEPNPIIGNIVCARVNLVGNEDPKLFARRLIEFCGGRLSRFKVPLKVEVTDQGQHSARFKKTRRGPTTNADTESSVFRGPSPSNS